MKNKKIRIPISIVFFILTAAVMYVIFSFSSDTGEQSEEISQGLLSVIISRIGDIISENFLRKTAHFSEYAALGFLMTGAIYFAFDKRKFYIPLIPCFIYSVSDEIHQYFVPDRACRIFDIFIDTCGSLLGIVVFLIIAMLIVKINNKTKEQEK